MARRALITGAGTGIGRAIAEELSRRGDVVIATARRPEALSEVAADLKLVLDVDDDQSVRGAVEAAGAVDVLINNAGIGLGGPSEAVPMAELRRLFETNLFGAVRLIQAVLPQMRERRAGTIVNMSSIAARLPWPFGGFYAASKAALESVSEALAVEVADLGVRVLIVEPGVIRTNLVGAGFTLFGQDLAEYQELGAQWGAHFNESYPGPEVVAVALADALSSPSPPLRLEVGEDAVDVLGLRRALSDERLEVEFRRFYKLSERRPTGVSVALGTPAGSSPQ